MSFLQSILLGLFQGVAEFLPISSSGHLFLLKNLMNLKEVPLSYDIMLHVATLVVVVVIYRRKILEILLSFFRFVRKKSQSGDKKNLGILLTLVIATFITGCAGLLLRDVLPENPFVVSCLLLTTGFILLFSKVTEIYWQRRKLIPCQSFSPASSVFVGVVVGIAQSIGVFPGISRSGITISSALMVHTDKKDAGDISFLVSIPAIAGAMILDLGKLDSLFATVSPLVMASGMISAMISGAVALLLLLKLINSGRFYYFSLYLIPVGIAGMIYFS